MAWIVDQAGAFEAPARAKITAGAAASDRAGWATCGHERKVYFARMALFGSRARSARRAEVVAGKDGVTPVVRTQALGTLGPPGAGRHGRRHPAGLDRRPA